MLPYIYGKLNSMFPSMLHCNLIKTPVPIVARFEEPDDDALNQTLDGDLGSFVTPQTQLSIPGDADSGRITFGDEDNMNTSLDFEEEDEPPVSGGGDYVGVARMIDTLQDTLLHVSKVIYPDCGISGFSITRSQVQNILDDIIITLLYPLDIYSLGLFQNLQVGKHPIRYSTSCQQMFFLENPE